MPARFFMKGALFYSAGATKLSGAWLAFFRPENQ
jgi:hypothetical protein